MYLVFADLLKPTLAERETVETPQNFRQALELLEASLDIKPDCFNDCETTKQYYDALVKHEIK